MLTERHVSGSLFRAFIQLDTVAERPSSIPPAFSFVFSLVSNRSDEPFELLDARIYRDSPGRTLPVGIWHEIRGSLLWLIVSC